MAVSADLARFGSCCLPDTCLFFAECNRFQEAVRPTPLLLGTIFSIQIRFLRACTHLPVCASAFSLAPWIIDGWCMVWQWVMNCDHTFDDGTTFDLRPLTRTAGRPDYAGRDKFGNMYYMNICSVSSLLIVSKSLTAFLMDRDVYIMCLTHRVRQTQNVQEIPKECRALQKAVRSPVYQVPLQIRPSARACMLLARATACIHA